MKKFNRIEIVAIVIASFGIFLDSAASVMYLPALPSLLDNMHISRSWTQLCVPAMYCGFMLSLLLFGYFIYRCSQKWLLILLLLLYIIGAVLTLSLLNIYYLLGGMFVQGLGLGLTYSLSLSFVKEIFKDKSIRILSYINMIFAFSTPLGLILGAHLSQLYGWSSIFYVLIAISIVFVICCLFLPSTQTTSKYKPNSYVNYLYQIRNQFNSPVFLKNTLSLSLFTANLGVFYTISPFLFVHDLHYSPSTYSYLMLIPTSGLFLGSVLSGKLISAYSPEALVRFSIVWGVFISILIFLTSLILLNGLLIMILFMFYFIGYGLNSSCTRIGAMSVSVYSIAFAGVVCLVSLDLITASGTIIAAHIDDELLSTLVLVISILNMVTYYFCDRYCSVHSEEEKHC